MDLTSTDTRLRLRWVVWSISSFSRCLINPAQRAVLIRSGTVPCSFQWGWGAIDQIGAFWDVETPRSAQLRSDLSNSQGREVWSWKMSLLTWCLTGLKMKSPLVWFSRAKCGSESHPQRWGHCFQPTGKSLKSTWGVLAPSFHPTSCPVTCSCLDRQSLPWWKIAFLSILNKIPILLALVPFLREKLFSLSSLNIFRKSMDFSYYIILWMFLLFLGCCVICVYVWTL